MKRKVMLREKLFRVSIIIIALFTATIFFVTNSNVNNLVDKNISEKLDCVSKMGMDIFKSKYDGDWNVKDGKLYIGETPVNNNFEVVDAIKEKTGLFSTVYLGDERVATSILEKDKSRAIGARATNEVTESVLQKGVAYEGKETLLGEKCSVKYVPIKDKTGKVVGAWFVGIPDSSAGNQDSKILQMGASIVVISILCGMLGCLILMLYSRKYLKDIDTLKVSYLGSDSNHNRTQRKVLITSLFLIGTFIVIWVPIQGFTIGNVVTKLVDSNVNAKMDVCSELGYMMIDEQYKGDWSIQGDKLLKGTNYLNDDSKIVDRISSYTGFTSSVFMGNTRISTNSLRSDSKRPLGNRASNEVVETVLKQGKEYSGETTDLNRTFISRYSPLKDSSGKVIGMWYMGVDKKFISNQITGLRIPISQISILAIIIAFFTFLFLSRRLAADVKNYDVRLSA